MAQQSLNLGSNANDGTGDDLRSAMTKVQANFTELYTDVSELMAETAVNSQISFSGNKMFANVSNADLVLEPAGTGSIILGDISIKENEIKTTRSNDALQLTANGTGEVQISSGSDVVITPTDDLWLSPSDDLYLAPETGTGDVYHYLLGGTKEIWEQHKTADWEILHTHTGVDGSLGTGSAVLPSEDDTMWNLKINGHSTTSNINTFATSAAMEFSAAENWTTTKFGTQFKLKTTVAGTNTAPATRFHITSTGSIEFANLSFNAGAITGLTTNQNIVLTPNGTGQVLANNLKVDGQIQITDNEIKTTTSNANLELSANGSGKITLSGLKFPSSDGSADQVLKTDGSGNLSFTTISGATLTNSAATDGNATISNSTATAIATFAIASHRGGKFLVQITDATNSRYETHELLVTHDGTNAYHTQSSVKSHTAPDLATFTTDINSGNFRLLAQNSNSSSMVYKVYKNLINI